MNWLCCWQASWARIEYLQELLAQASAEIAQLELQQKSTSLATTEELKVWQALLAPVFS